MTTLPIEVIVQDAEASVVPSEDGTNNTETNIAVPDTGTISSSGDTSSSTSSIILPAILLVLALGSIVAILIHKYHKQKKDKTSSKKEKLTMAATSTISVLVATVLVSNLILPATKAATSDSTDGITPAEDKISVTVTRDGSGMETSIESKATITSSSDFGYKVLLSMAEGVEIANLYLDGDETSEHYIAPVEAEEGTELADNTWGYALTEDGEYAAVPLVDNAATVSQGNEAVEDEGLSIYYGVKVSSDLPTGTYSGGEIEYALEAIPGFPDTLVYMQDMTPEICAAAPTPGNQVTDPVPTATLIDSRDNKTYTIAKLADGKCWMTQNLDLDLKKDGSIVYDSTNTNLTANTVWEPENATIAKNDLSSDTWQMDGNNPYSYDPGDVYYYTSGSDTNDVQYNSLAECVAANHTEVECRHYHAGNYYNWSAAIASNNSEGITEQHTNVDTDICPAGWELPDGPQNSTDPFEDNEFNALIVSQDGIAGERPTFCSGLCPFYNYADGGFNKIRTAPLWLARSGYVLDGSLSDTTSDGTYWSSTVYDSDIAHYLYFGSGSVNPTGSNSRDLGYSIRCIAQ